MNNPFSLFAAYIFCGVMTWILCPTLLFSAESETSPLKAWHADGKAFKSKKVFAEWLADSSDAIAGKGAKGTLRSDPFTVSSDYLNFEIAGGDLALRTALNLWVDGKVVCSASARRSDQFVKRSFDLRPFAGKKAFIEIVDHEGEPQSNMRAGGYGFVRVRNVEFSQEPWALPAGDIAEAEAIARKQAGDFVAKWVPKAQADPRRPVWHMRPPAGRLNDANGPFWADGYYHLFYQYNPMISAYMAWGHVRSKDLVNWEHLPLALWPEWSRGEYQCYSGSALVKNGKPLLFYTFVPVSNFPRSQWIARPKDDDFALWEKPEFNPVISYREGEIEGMMPSVRDPFLFEAEGRTFALLCGNDIYLYEAQDDALKTWRYRGKIWEKSSGERGAECPNFFQFGDKWVLMYSPFGPVAYQTGTFDPDAGKFAVLKKGLVNHASGFYATTGTKDGRGRTILYGHLKGMVPGNQIEKVGWRDVLAMPRVLELADDNTIRVRPVEEIEILRGEKLADVKNQTLPEGTHCMPGCRGDVLELDAVLKPLKDTKRFGLRVRANQKGENGVEIVYDAEKGTLFIPGSRAQAIALPLEDGMLDVRVFLDKAMLEVFAGDGRAAETRTIPVSVPEQDVQIAFFAEGGGLEIVEAAAWRLNPTKEGKVTDIFLVEHAKNLKTD